MDFNKAALGKYLVHRPEALEVSRHASRALQSHCCKPIFFHWVTFLPLKICGA